MASRKKSKNISGKHELPNSISCTTSVCSSFRLIFPFAFRKTLIESKYTNTHSSTTSPRQPSCEKYSADRFWLTFTVNEPISISRPLADGLLENAILQAGGLSRPLPTPLPPVFLLLLNLFNMAPEIEFASSIFPPSHKTASYAG